MEAVNYVIVRLEQAYNNEVTTENGESIIVNSTIEEVSYINRVATIVSAPSFTILKEGDKVVVHHNIFRLRNNVKGNLTESNFHLGDGEYFVPLTEVFMYKRDSEWVAIDPYCFVEPIEVESDFTSRLFSLSIEESSYKGRKQNVGIIKYVNKSLSAQGVKVGDKVKFTKNSEYEFNIDGVLLYKMSTKDIIAVV